MATTEKATSSTIDLKAPLITEKALAAYLNVSLKLIQKWRYAGGGPRFVRVGRTIRYRPEDINDFVTAGLRANTST